MTVFYFLYIFDTDNYKRMLKPLVNDFLSGDFSELQILSSRIVKEKPELWKELEYFRYYPDELGNEKEVYDSFDNIIDFWLTIVLLNHCSRVHLPDDYVLRMREAKAICDSNDSIESILWGSNLQTFYEQLLEEVKGEQDVSIADVPLWCKPGMIYWHKYKEITPLIRWINTNKTCFSKTPTMFNTITLVEQIFTRAIIEHKGLLMATLD